MRNKLTDVFQGGVEYRGFEHKANASAKQADRRFPGRGRVQMMITKQTGAQKTGVFQGGMISRGFEHQVNASTKQADRRFPRQRGVQRI